MRTTYLLLGHLSLAAGFVGIFVPLLPTTPFILLAAVCYSRGSDKFHTWLNSHPRFGPLIQAWSERGAIGVRAKVLASVTIAASIAFSVVKLSHPWSMVALFIGLAVLTFILSRPTE